MMLFIIQTRVFRFALKGVIEAWDQAHATYMRVVAREREQLQNILLARNQNEKDEADREDEAVCNTDGPIDAATPDHSQMEALNSEGQQSSETTVFSGEGDMAGRSQFEGEEIALERGDPVAIEPLLTAPQEVSMTLDEEAFTCDRNHQDGKDEEGSHGTAPRDCIQSEDLLPKADREDVLQSDLLSELRLDQQVPEGNSESQGGQSIIALHEDNKEETEEMLALRLEEEAELERQQVAEAEAEAERQRIAAEEQERSDVKALVSERLCVLFVDPGVGHTETPAMNRAVREFLCHHLLSGSGIENGLSTTIQRRIVIKE